MSQYFNVLKYFFGLIMDYANILFSLLKTLFEEQSTQNHIFLVSLFYNSKFHDHFFDFGSKVISPKSKFSVYRVWVRSLSAPKNLWLKLKFWTIPEQGGVHVACSRATTKRCSSVQKLSIKNAFIFKIRATYLKISRAFGANV